MKGVKGVVGREIGEIYMEKLKKLLNSNYFLIPILLVEFYFLFLFIFGKEGLTSFFEWKGWEGVSSIVLAITFIYIAKQAYATQKSTKFLEYQTRPITWFFLMSPQTLNHPDKKNWFFVKNESKYTIFFYYKLIGPQIDDGKRALPYNGPWQNENDPLHVYPTLMQYPDVIPILPKELIQEAIIKDKKIRIDIHCGFAPEYAEKTRYSKASETWRFSPKEEIWEGPNGIKDTGFLNYLYLFNEKYSKQ